MSSFLFSDKITSIVFLSEKVSFITGSITEIFMVCFDMDSTLIQTEVIDELAELAGVGEQVRAITESAMNGEIDFSESFKKRMALLEGLSEEVLQKVGLQSCHWNLGMRPIRCAKINMRTDFRCPGKHLHRLQLRETDDTQILRRINNRFYHQKANNMLLSLF